VTSKQKKSNLHQGCAKRVSGTDLWSQPLLCSITLILEAQCRNGLQT
jgi:hypothetical protein